MREDALDLVVFGATGFVGRLVCEYLAERSPEDGRAITWAMAGRSLEKLAAVRDELPASAAAVELLVADADDEASLRSLCERARVVVSTVGPYALYGETLIRVCAETGTDYCDLTGEVLWVRRMMDRHGATARESGARLLPSCGFDSIPSDLGVHFTQQVARREWGHPAEGIHMRVKAIRGGLSGGTIASMLNIINEVRGDPQRRRQMADPYLLCPPGHGFRQRQHEYRRAFRDPASGRWAAPFIMAGVNTRVVHRSNALAGDDGVPAFRYDEAMLTGRGWRGGLSAMSFSLGLGVFALAAWFRPMRRLLQRFLLPAPGQGPSRDQREKGFFDLRFYAIGPAGRQRITRVHGNRDPGYGATARMLGEAAVCLARDVPASVQGGFHTPASLLGVLLIRRLEARAGIIFESQPD